MGKQLKRGLSLLLILALVLGSVYLADRVLLIKRYDGVKPMQSFYAQAPNTVDVLLLGNSHMGVHVDTATLWREYGISAFALWGGVQPMWNTYYFLVEALKTQSPKAVVLEVGGLSYDWEYADEATQLKNVAGMNPSLNKWAAVKATAPRDRWASLMLGLPLYHQRYGEVTREDFQFFPWSTELINNKGSFALYGHGNFDLTDPNSITEKAEISQKSLDYFMDIVSLCRERDIALILVKTPTTDIKKYQPYCNAVADIAAREQLPFYNFNLLREEIGVTGEDFYFDTHMNLSGARKLSRALADILMDQIGPPDHRGDPVYASWEVNAETINDAYLCSITENEDYFAELQRGGRAVLLVKNGSWENREPYLSFVESLGALGFDESQLLDDGSGAWLISDVPAGEVSPKGLSFQIDGKSYEIDLDQRNSITENGSIVYSFHNIGITMLIYDYTCGRIIDTVDFLHTSYFELSRN